MRFLRSLVVAAVAASLLAAAPIVTAAGGRNYEHLIACGHVQTGRFTGEEHPTRCNLGGYHGRKFVEFQIRGMNWGHWGHSPTRAAYGRDRLTGKAVRVVAYRPVECGEESSWYSRAVVLFPATGKGVVLRLPTCAAGS